MLRCLIFLAGIVSLTYGFWIKPLSADLLMNSSFETPSILAGGDFLVFTAGQTIGTGWTVDALSSSAALLLKSGAFGGPTTNDGGQYVLFGDETNFGILRQDVALDASASYLLTFELSPQINVAGSVRVDVLRNNTSILGGAAFFSVPPGNPFVRMELPFNSLDAGAYRLVVTAAGPSSSVDAFNLVSIPEPSAVTFMLVSTLNLVSFRRRRT